MIPSSDARCGRASSLRGRSLRSSATYLTLVLLAAVLLLPILSGCGSSSSPDDADAALNDQLTELLNTAAAGKGVAYFAMPESDDYANIPQDPRNPITKEKVELGKLLYHETALTVRPKNMANSMQGSCASCHHADAGFQAGVAQGIGTGGMGFGLRGEARTKDPQCAVEEMDIQPIRSPSAMNVAWQTNILWNGQFGATGLNVGTSSQWTAGTPKEKNFLGYEGLETQAIAGEDVHRMDISKSLVVDNPTYQQMFAAAFPDIPADERITDVTSGLAIAAYERTLLSNHAPFQKWVHGDHSAMDAQQLRGAIVFFGKGQCASCHTGPTLNSMTFYGLGMAELVGDGVYGEDPTKPEHKGRGGFTGNPEDLYKFKTPQLYNLTDSKFYGHGATFHSVREVVEYLNAAEPQDKSIPASQISSMFKPLGLTSTEIDDLVAFLEKGLYDSDLSRYVPTSLPSGFCFPDNDPQARQDRGCQ